MPSWRAALPIWRRSPPCFLPRGGYMHGETPTGIDAAIYGFIANIYFYDIDTPLKRFVVAHDNVMRHCQAIHEAVIAKPAA